MTELKPCPFCGAMPKTEVQGTKMDGLEDHVDFSVRCTKCATDKTVRLKIVTPCFFHDVENAMYEARKAWNRRAGEQDV